MICETYRSPFIDPRPMEIPIKLPLSVGPSVYVSILSQCYQNVIREMNQINLQDNDNKQSVVYISYTQNRYVLY